jgi:CRISPR/Cas system-associated exonuclease Cas4 (RecB family)
MTKNLLKQIMLKPTEENDEFGAADFIKTIEGGYVSERGTKFQKKKMFSPSKIAYGEGECPRYWYLAFEGANFEDNASPYDVANMDNGTLSHERILGTAFKNSGILIDYEFELKHEDPPIYGKVDGLVNWKDNDVVVEVKTTNEQVFEYRKKTGKAKTGHIIQTLIYMKVLKKAHGVIVYENKNNHELLAIPVNINDHYIQWIDNAFEWMRQVRKAWEDKQLPMKNYRSNSKICKHCPLQSDCAKAEAGVIKIASLEELSETL